MKKEAVIDGVTSDRFQDIYIPLPNNGNRCRIQVAKGDSRSWYVGYSVQLPSSGSGYAPFPKFSEQYPDRDAAVVAGARLAQAYIFKSKKPTGNSESQILGALDEVIARHQLGDKPKLGFIFGWKYGGNGYQLYIQIYPNKMKPEDKPAGMSKCAWGVTSRIEEAFRFKSLAACLDRYRSHHAWPAEYEANLWNGNVQFFQVTSTGVHQVWPTEQPSLFDGE